MQKIEYHYTRFKEKDDVVRAIFYKYFYVDINKSDLEMIGHYEIKDNNLYIDASEKKLNRLDLMIESKIKNELKNLQGNPATFVDEESGIPLLGEISFGLTDRNTSAIEIRPMTGCNVACTFCSVNEGFNIKNRMEFVVEKNYLKNEIIKLAKHKGIKVDLVVNPMGESLMYEPLPELIKELNETGLVNSSMVITNGVLLTEALVDKLIDAKLSLFSISLHSLNQSHANEIAGTYYNVDHVKKMVEYIRSKGGNVILCPVWVKGLNDDDMDDIIQFAKQTGSGVGIQNYQKNKMGRNPYKEHTWDIFYDYLKTYEQDNDIVLIHETKDVFSNPKMNKVEKPFKKGDVIDAEILFEGHKSGMIAVAQDRAITILNPKKKGKAKIKILRDKHNTFVGKVL